MSDLSLGPSLGGVSQSSNRDMLLRNVLFVSSSHSTSPTTIAKVGREQISAVKQTYRSPRSVSPHSYLSVSNLRVIQI